MSSQRSTRTSAAGRRGRRGYQAPVPSVRTGSRAAVHCASPSQADAAPPASLLQYQRPSCKLSKAPLSQPSASVCTTCTEPAPVDGTPGRAEGGSG
eukprot:272794-Rhodomonas_salina.1